ncbi:hypothetical protein [Streptomyces sp. NPDC046862]|uniref:hypothetical protein n=1 Tax=Streptomyces sp. NPDC046862 TaxID=3154603 RepID=UPI003454DE2E
MGYAEGSERHSDFGGPLTLGAAMTANEIGGSAHLSGVAVQAGSVSGGIHHYASVSASSVPEPRQLPRVPRHFTGRQEEVCALDAAREGGATLVVLSGIAGVGKSALATRWLRDHGSYRDGQLYADLRSTTEPRPPEMVLQQWLHAFGLDKPPADLMELTTLWRSVSARRNVAVLLDNAVAPEQVRPLLPAGDSSMTVVTSRCLLWELGVDGAELHPLGPFTPSAALKLLAKFAGEARVAADPEAASRLTRACAYLALPLVLTGARLAARPQHSLSVAADALTRRTSETSHHKDHAHMVMHAALDESYANLDATAQQVYRFLSLLPVDDLDPDMVAAACRLEWGDADWLLEVLADEHLLAAIEPHEIRPVRYRMGEAVGEHARRLAMQHDDKPTRDGVLRRLSKWVLEVAAHAQIRLTPAQATLRKAEGLPSLTVRLPFEDEAGAIAWLASQQGNLLGVLRAAEEMEWDELVWQLVDAFWPLFLRQHPYELWVAAHEMGLAAARRAGHGPAIRQMLNSGAIGLSSAGRLDEAIGWYAEAVEAAQAAGDVRDEGQALLGLGACHFESGHAKFARPHLTLAAERWLSCDYQRGVALVSVLLGEIDLAEGHTQRALEQFAGAHELLVDVEDPYDAARALALHGHALVVLGDLEAGVAELEKALRTFVEAGSTRWRARTLEMLGGAHRVRGDATLAGNCYRQAADLYFPIRPADAERVRALAGAL